MKWKFLIALFLIVTASSCGENKSVNETEVFQIREVGTLSTSEYTVGKVIKLTQESDFLESEVGFSPHSDQLSREDKSRCGPERNEGIRYRY